MDKLRKVGDQGSVDHEQPVISSYIMIHLVSKSCTVWSGLENLKDPFLDDVST